MSIKLAFTRVHNGQFFHLSFISDKFFSVPKRSNNSSEKDADYGKIDGKINHAMNKAIKKSNLNSSRNI